MVRVIFCIDWGETWFEREVMTIPPESGSRVCFLENGTCATVGIVDFHINEGFYWVVLEYSFGDDEIEKVEVELIKNGWVEKSIDSTTNEREPM